MVERDDGVRAGLGEVLQAAHLQAVEGAEEDREEVAERARRQGAEDRDAGRRCWPAARPARMRHRDAGASAAPPPTSAPADHEGGGEHVDGGDHARAPVGAGPGLHGREGRDDEEAARDRKPREVDRDAPARAGRARKARAPSARHRPAPRRRSRRPRSSPKAPMRKAADGRRQEHDAAAARARTASPEPSAMPIEKTARRAVTTSSVPPSTFFTSGGSSESVTAPTSQNQDTITPPRQSRRIRPEVLQQRVGRAQDVGIDSADPARPRRSRDHEARGPAQHGEADEQAAERGRVAARRPRHSRRRWCRAGSRGRSRPRRARCRRAAPRARGGPAGCRT